ncbi:MAG: universal stress protein [Deferrisomatales bacterium]
MYKKILVPLDGSPLAEGVLPQVEYLAKLTGAEVCVLRVVRVHTFPGVDPTEAEYALKEQAESYLAGVAGRLRDKGLEVSVHLRFGHEAEEILDQARDADLVAMSTHGRTGLGRWAMGGVAERVLRHCPVPVLLCRSGEGSRRSP